MEEKLDVKELGKRYGCGALDNWGRGGEMCADGIGEGTK